MDQAGIDVSTLANGTVTFTARATDSAGNTSESNTSPINDANTAAEPFAQFDNSQPLSTTALVDEALAKKDFWL